MYRSCGTAFFSSLTTPCFTPRFSPGTSEAASGSNLVITQACSEHCLFTKCPPRRPATPFVSPLNPDATEAERALLHTWGDEHPSPALLQQTLAVLGLGGAVGIVAAGSSIAPKALAGWVVVAKWLGLAIMTATAVAAVTYVLSPSRTVAVKSAFVSPWWRTWSPPRTWLPSLS